MATITDLKEWLKHVDNDDANEMEQLYYAVKNGEEDGFIFSCQSLPSDKYLIRCSYEQEELLLLSSKARDYFLEYLETTYADGDVDANAAFHRAIEKND
ncbi:MAG: hypothetical protein EOO43_09580 [Flavobacterium sp.]|nr:MAG: hypothetical protein EOO43_09580 [Flavobacterium sp.]